MGKKSKGDRKTKTGRHEDEEEEENEYMTDMAMVNQGSAQQDTPSTSSGEMERVGQNDSQIDSFLDGIENLSNKKTQARLNGLNSIIVSLQSGADLFDRVSSNMDTLIEHLKSFLSSRSSSKEAVLAMKVVNILALVAGAENDAFAEEFSELLINLATKSSIEEVDVRVAAVRTLAFVHLVCCGGGQWGGYACFGVLGGVALAVSEGTDVCPELQIAAVDAWCLLANMMDPQKVCEMSREEDLFIAVVGLLDSSNNETKILAGQCLALLWEVADKLQPGVDATISAELICDDPDKVQEAIATLQQIGKESSKRINKRDRKERKSALKSVTDWVLEGNPPEGDVLYLLGGEVRVSSFGETRVLDYLRSVLRGGVQSCLRVFPVTRDMLGVEFVSFDSQDEQVSEASAGGGVTCESFDKRFVRSQMGKMKTNHRRNQRADKEMLQSDCL